MEDEKGVKQDPEETPSSGTGEPAQAPPPGDTGIEFKDDDAKEFDSKKYVPLEALVAERKKRQEVEAKLSSPEPEPAPTETPPVEEPKSLELDWNAILGGDKGQPEGGEQPAASQQRKSPVDDLNSWIRDNIEDHPIETISYVFNMLESQRNTQRNQARKFVGENYEKLPLYDVSDQEVVVLQQNPEALRALIAQARFGKTTKAPVTSPEPGPADSNDAFKKREQKIREEERQKVLEQLKQSAGLSTEGATGGESSTEETFELDEAGRAYARRRGYKTPEQMAEFVKLYKAELDRQATR